MTCVGRALCIGVDAEDDARTFASIARSGGCGEPLLLLGAAATCSAVRSAFRELASVSGTGDLAIVAFSGHGGRKRLPIPGEDLELAAIWQLYDGSLNDRQVREHLMQFRQGVRILVLSDNCSGGVPEYAPSSACPPISASVTVLAASQPHQYADGPGLPGHFADAVSRVWNGGAFPGTYHQFYRALWQSMPDYQKPDFYCVGVPDTVFDSQRPFAV